MSSSNTSSTTDLYDILGVCEQSSTDQINAEFRHQALLHHPDRPDRIARAGEHATFQELAYARDILTNRKTRVIYNEWRRSGQDVSDFPTWLKMKTQMQHSVHWVSTPKTRTRCLTEGSEVDHFNAKSPPKSSLIDRFRAYDI